MNARKIRLESFIQRLNKTKGKNTITKKKITTKNLKNLKSKNKRTTPEFELRTFYLDACNPARYPNDPSHPKARLQEEPCLPKNIKSNVQWSTVQ